MSMIPKRMTNRRLGDGKGKNPNIVVYIPDASELGSSCLNDVLTYFGFFESSEFNRAFTSNPLQHDVHLGWMPLHFDPKPSVVKFYKQAFQPGIPSVVVVMFDISDDTESEEETFSFVFEQFKVYVMFFIEYFTEQNLDMSTLSFDILCYTGDKVSNFCEKHKLRSSYQKMLSHVGGPSIVFKGIHLVSEDQLSFYCSQVVQNFFQICVQLQRGLAQLWKKLHANDVVIKMFAIFDVSNGLCYGCVEGKDTEMYKSACIYLEKYMNKIPDMAGDQGNWDLHPSGQYFHVWKRHTTSLTPISHQHVVYMLINTENEEALDSPEVKEAIYVLKEFFKACSTQTMNKLIADIDKLRIESMLHSCE